MLVRGVAMLAADTVRSKIYLQIMQKAGLQLEKCIVFGKPLSSGGGQFKKTGEKECGIDLSESLETILEDAGIDYEEISEKDINSFSMSECISNIKQKYIIYSGYGGAILKPHLFRLGKKFIHVHAGILPQYRGSTTGYYSILRESAVGATAIFLNEGIDQGEVLYQETFPLPSFSVDIDYVYEPWARAQVLVRTLQQYLDRECKFSPSAQSNDDAETYYIIHPVLKHLALRKTERARRK